MVWRTAGPSLRVVAAPIPAGVERLLVERGLA
jgi:hypothetical protein